MTTIFHDTRRLATPSGRKPGTRGHASARRYIELRFAQIGLRPYADHADWRSQYTARVAGRSIEMTNLIGVVRGENPLLDPIVLGAHYDSVIEGHCADDNASSVAVMLNLAQRFADAPLSRDVVVCAFDGEEPPYFHSPAMGSTRFVEDHLEGCHLAVITDLIGHALTLPGVDPFLTVMTGVESHPALSGILGDVELPVIATRNTYVGDMSDHHAFRLAGHPFLFLSSGEWENYHTYQDLPGYLDYAKLDMVADAIEAMVRRADTLELGQASKHDTTDLEWATLREHLPAELLDSLGDTPQRVINRLRSQMAGWVSEDAEAAAALSHAEEGEPALPTWYQYPWDRWLSLRNRKRRRHLAWGDDPAPA